MKKISASLLLILFLITSVLSVSASAEIVKIKTPTYDQCANGYVNGCEGFALFQALKGKGYAKDVSIKKFMNSMPRSKSNPNLGFVGDPTKGWNASVNKGKRTTIFPPALTKWAIKYGNAQNISGSSYDRLKSELRAGNPIVIWVTYKWQDPIWKSYSWGRAVTNGHVLTLVGFDSEKKQWLVNDPYQGKGEYFISQKTMKRTWESRRYAVVVRSKAYLNVESLVLEEGETSKTKINLVNAGGDRFVSSDKSVVKVSDDTSGGVIKAVGAGSATLSTTYNGKKYVCKIKVTKKPELSSESVSLFAGETKKLDLKNVEGEKFSSSEPSVATVSTKGIITAVGEGKATISVTYRGKTFKCSVSVKSPQLSKTELDLFIGDSVRLDLEKVSGESFASADKSVAEVDEKGVVSALEVGKTAVNVVYAGRTYVCTVIVSAPPELIADEDE